MFTVARNSGRLAPASRLAVVGVLVTGMLIPVTSPAAAGPDPALAPRVPPPAAPGPPPPGVSPTPAAVPDVQRWPINGRPELKARPKDGRFTIESFTCMPYLFAGASGIGYDQYLEEVVGLGYEGGVECDAELEAVFGDVGLVDRSPSFNGQWFDGQWLAASSVVGWGYSWYGSGGVTVYTRGYNGARYVEPILSLTLFAPFGTYWEPCGFVPGLYYYQCSGEGTSVLTVVMGAGVWWTGLTQACRDQAVRGDAEERRLDVVSGSTPASTQILGLIPTIRDRVTAFKRALCGTSAAGASGFAVSQGQQLWDTAVAAAKNAATQNDDRPLYWARLSMTLAIEQWRPAFTPDRPALRKSLDRAARGMNSHSFTFGTSTKVVVSGFDPFQLDGAIMRGNPSAAAVLGLDNTILNGAEVQVVVFPVRGRDFDEFIVEDTFTQHLIPGSAQEATLITTVSQGRPGRFDLEYWNGRNRTGGNDNLNVSIGGSFFTPFEPPYQASGKQFARTTLPVDSMRVGSPYTVCLNFVLWEQPSPGSSPVRRPPGTDSCPPPPAPTPTPDWYAVEGGGGGYLSNEIAYRVTELRDRLGSSALAGHVHTPTMAASPTPSERNGIVNQYRQILSAAIAATSGGGSACTISVTGGTHNCAGVPGISVQSLSGGRLLLRLTFSPGQTARLAVTYGTAPTGFTVNIGDSATNDGGGGDGGTQSNDAEMMVQGQQMSVFGRDGTPTYPLQTVPNAGISAGETVNFEVADRTLCWNFGTQSCFGSEWLYALNGQPDTEGGVNYDVYAAFNQVITGRSDRLGTGVSSVTVSLS